MFGLHVLYVYSIYELAYLLFNEPFLNLHEVTKQKEVFLSFMLFKLDF